MSWYFSTAAGKEDFSEYFDFNQIPYHRVDVWDTTLDYCGMHRVPQTLTGLGDAKLVIDTSELVGLMQTDYNALINFLGNNKIIVYQDIDSYVSFFSKLQDKLEHVNSKIPKNHLHIVFDATPSDRICIDVFKNIRFTILRYGHFLNFPRVSQGTTEKNKNGKDFLLTTIKKPGRPHRDLLWQALQKCPYLIDNSLLYCKSRDQPWIGETIHQHNWQDGHPSMDLYRNCYVELVPETLYKDGFFITEKTTKPIATKTPFLMISNCGYLEFLKQQGFQTFDTLIDESYDAHYRIEDRIDAVVHVMHDIVKNGSEDFYRQSKPILEHNQQRLFEISGSWRYYRDLDYRDIIDQMS